MVLLQTQFNFPLTPYIEDCCKSLYNAAESPYDKYIMYLIHLQRIAEKVDRLSMRHAIELGNPGSASELYVSALKGDLETFRSEFLVGFHEIREFLIILTEQSRTNNCLYSSSWHAVPCYRVVSVPAQSIYDGSPLSCSEYI
jgi:hypothetical protein